MPGIEKRPTIHHEPRTSIEKLEEFSARIYPRFTGEIRKNTIEAIHTVMKTPDADIAMLAYDTDETDNPFGFKLMQSQGHSLYQEYNKIQGEIDMGDSPASNINTMKHNLRFNIILRISLMQAAESLKFKNGLEYDSDYIQIPSFIAYVLSPENKHLLKDDVPQ